jgi:spore germination cell wall hydrolase CwlJ-like protein
MKRLIVAVVSLLVMMTTSAYAMTETNFVASVIAAEAGGEGYKGMYAVACVIQNRMEMQHKTACQIVRQKNQFYGATAKNRLKNYNKVKEIADSIAKQIGKLKDNTKGALYFRRPDERLFKWCKVMTIRVKNHIFYK